MRLDEYYLFCLAQISLYWVDKVKTNYLFYCEGCRTVAQLGSAPSWGVGGRRFKSSQSDHNPKKFRYSFRVLGHFYRINNKNNINLPHEPYI